jgi:EF hand
MLMRTKAIKFSLMAGGLLTLSGAAAAAQPGQDGPPGRGGPRGEATRDQAVARADRMFERLDANHDGRVTGDEARQAMAARGGGPRAGRPDGPGGPQGGPPPGMFDRIDRDHNGMISREEFAQLPPPGGPGGPEGPGGPGRGERRGRAGGGMMAMQMFGPNGATREEFRARALARFDRMDANHDGRITPDERPQRRGSRPGADDGHPAPEGD